jgi:hypothetical protein
MLDRLQGSPGTQILAGSSGTASAVGSPDFVNKDGPTSLRTGAVVLNVPLIIVLGYTNSGPVNATMKVVQDGTTLQGDPTNEQRANPLLLAVLAAVVHLPALPRVGGHRPTTAVSSSPSSPGRSHCISPSFKGHAAGLAPFNGILSSVARAMD